MKMFDGDDQDFPNRKAAMNTYKMHWYSYLFTKDPVVREVLETELDKIQQEICYGPGPLWDEFTGSLPGYTNSQEVSWI